MRCDGHTFLPFILTQPCSNSPYITLSYYTLFPSTPAFSITSQSICLTYPSRDIPHPHAHPSLVRPSYLVPNDRNGYGTMTESADVIHSSTCLADLTSSNSPTHCSTCRLIILPRVTRTKHNPAERHLLGFILVVFVLYCCLNIVVM